MGLGFTNYRQPRRVIGNQDKLLLSDIKSLTTTDFLIVIFHRISTVGHRASDAGLMVECVAKVNVNARQVLPVKIIAKYALQ